MAIRWKFGLLGKADLQEQDTREYQAIIHKELK